MLTSPLPMELGPTLEGEGTSRLGSRPLEGLRFPTNPGTESGGLEDLGGSLFGSWLPSGLKPLKSRGLQPQNFWNPTYVCWAPRLRVRAQALMLALVPPCTPP